jgi:hypothetical protein
MALRWKVETASWEWRGVVCGKSAPPRLQPPPMSIRDRWVAPASKYWTYRSHAGIYGPSKPSSRHQQMLGFVPTASMVGSGEKLDTDPRIGQPAYCGLCREPFCLGAVALLNSVDDFTKDCYMWTMWDTYSRGSYTDQEWKACGVLVGFSPVGCTSIRIIATLGYE